MIHVRDRNAASFAQRLRTGWIRHGLTPTFISGLILCGIAHADEFIRRIDGDIGLGTFYTNSIIRSKTNPVSVLPYAYFSYDRAFIRLDTFGVKTLKLGYGHLEIVGRYSQDGFDADKSSLSGLSNRQTSIPFGIGTLQVTPVGAFFVNAFHDAGKSGGNLIEAIYAGKLNASWLTFYPLLGAEYRSSKYVRYYYGITAQESANSQCAVYQPAGAFNPFIGLMTDAKLSDEYYVNLYLRRRWLASSIQDSPIVNQQFLDTGFVALSYRFK